MKQKREIALLVVLVLIAAGIWWWYFRGDKPVVTADVGAAAKSFQPINVESPQLRFDEMAKARRTEYKGSGRNPFSPTPPTPPTPKRIELPPLPPQNIGPQPPPPPPTPVVPPLPVKFFGFGTIPNGTTRVAFFTNGEEVYVVSEGEVLLNRFRVLRIGNTNLDYEEVSSGLRGTAPLEEQAAPGGQ